MWYDLCVLAALALANFSCLLLLTEKNWVLKDSKTFYLHHTLSFAQLYNTSFLLVLIKLAVFKVSKRIYFANRDIFAFGCWCYKIFYDVGAEQYFLSGGDKSNCCYTKYCVFMLSKRDFLVFIIHRLLIKIPKQHYFSKVLACPGAGPIVG